MVSLSATRGHLLAAAVAMLPASPALAGTSIWSSSAGGAFSDPLSWSGPVPGATTLALFDLPGVYTVSFDAGALSEGAVVEAGAVRFDLDGHVYELLGAPPLPGLIVGDGAGGSASLELVGGTVMASTVAAGRGPSSFGLLQIDPGASLMAALHIHVGGEGIGLLNALDGATISAGRLTIGVEGSSVGLATIAGQSALVDVIDAVTVGLSGSGALHLASGAALASGTSIIAQTEFSEGSVVIDGAGTAWMVDGQLNVGHLGSAELTISGGGALLTSGPALVVGSSSFEPGVLPYAEVDVAGAGSRWTVGGLLHVAAGGTATMTVRDGGEVLSDSGLIGCCYFPVETPGGTVTVRGAGSLWQCAGMLANRHVLEVIDGGRVEAAMVHNTGTMVVRAGGAVEALFIESEPLGFVAPPSLIAGDGTIDGDLVNRGVLRPTSVTDLEDVYPPGTLTITGDLELDPESTLRIEVGSSLPQAPVLAGQLDIEGHVAIDGTLEIDSFGLLPPLSQGVTIITAGSVSGVFTDVIDPFPPVQGWTLAYFDESVRLYRGGPPPGDANFDDIVDVNDLVAIVVAWGPCPPAPQPCAADVNGDGTVDVDDLVMVISNWH